MLEIDCQFSTYYARTCWKFLTERLFQDTIFACFIKSTRHFPQHQVIASDYQDQCQDHSEAAARGVLKKGVPAKKRPVVRNVSKKKLWHRCFPVNFVKFQRTPFLQNTSGRLLLIIDLTGQKQTFADPEATVWICSSKKVFLKNSQYSQENICIGPF